MNQIIKNMRLLKMQRDKPEWADPIGLVEVLEDAEFAEPMTFGVKRRYVLRAEICVEFFANEAQLSRAIGQAKKLLASRLFSDALPIVHEIRSAAMDHDEERILRLCADLDKCFSVED